MSIPGTLCYVMLSVCSGSSSAPHDDDRGRGDDDDDNGGGKLCHIYAQIRESSTPSNVVVCSGDGETDQRRHHAAVEKLVYTSESHVVRVQLAAAAAADGDDAFFLIKFEGKNRGTDLRMPTASDRSVVAVYTVAPPGGKGGSFPPMGGSTSKNYVICVCFHCHGTASYHTTNTLQGRRAKSHVDTQTIQAGLRDFVL